jgi:hypothetical protein
MSEMNSPQNDAKGQHDGKENNAEKINNDSKEAKKDSAQVVCVKKYGYFAAILIVFMGLLILFSLLSNRKWQNGLRSQIESVLQESTNEKYVVGPYVYVKTPFVTSAAVYQLNAKQKKTNQYVVILRVTTMYGPLPAVFIYTSGKEAEFVDFIYFDAKSNQQIADSSHNAQIDYWCKRIPSIIQTGVQE